VYLPEGDFRLGLDGVVDFNGKRNEGKAEWPFQ
jgi:hypothetical protein